MRENSDRIREERVSNAFSRTPRSSIAAEERRRSARREINVHVEHGIISPAGEAQRGLVKLLRGAGFREGCSRMKSGDDKCRFYSRDGDAPLRKLHNTRECRYFQLQIETSARQVSK